MFCQSLLYSKETQLYTYIHSFLIFFSVMVYQRMLSDNSLLLKSPYGGTLLFIYSKCNSLFVTPNPSLSLLHPLATTSLFSPSMSLSLFCLWVHLCHILDSTCKWYHMVFVILFLTYFTYNSLAVPMLLQTAFFLWLSLIPFVYMHHIFFIHSSVDGHLGCSHVLAILRSAANEHRGACILLNYSFVQVYFQE